MDLRGTETRGQLIKRSLKKNSSRTQYSKPFPVFSGSNHVMQWALLQSSTAQEKHSFQVLNTAGKSPAYFLAASVQAVDLVWKPDLTPG